MGAGEDAGTKALLNDVSDNGCGAVKRTVVCVGFCDETELEKSSEIGKKKNAAVGNRQFPSLILNFV